VEGKRPVARRGLLSETKLLRPSGAVALAIAGVRIYSASAWPLLYGQVTLFRVFQMQVHCRKKMKIDFQIIHRVAVVCYFRKHFLSMEVRRRAPLKQSPFSCMS